ncbi:phenylacetaldoxime dehydratase [Verticillium dahliae VdLs.17]|uniref:Phenylacetaldoxime dehydratase n=1 Tax=Verticillium dahliae (strain VdLs.17 / ATCC MYA-4575 / FGSC 10137) TaxID=498257 RepID=G2XIY6_VERDV|nr:phenylacetaldoxime dehydratase [Verticillium dahliae VdLs.17]EGY20489.1 phenylacetaldoxime dehydratase [Verticillium dahliae VdLs.17]KAH6696329.1 phenylacetaldoxime dehydratase [Verticillium dahliae]
MKVESAIPEWLVRERTIPPNMPTNFDPPFELYTSRFPRNTKDLVLAVVGAQYPSASLNDGNAIKTISSFINLSSSSSRPGLHKVAAVMDNQGHSNIAVLLYWKSKANHDDHQHGWFLEVFYPTIDRFETVITTEVPQGAANLRETMSGPIQEHVYWGSLARSTSAPSSATGRRVVPGKKNLVVIRSGQDWSVAAPEERQLYLNTMHPVLIKGMDFLRDQGDQVGCFSCRFMEIVDPVTQKGGTDQTFGLAYFDSLASLEKWSKEHRTHLEIFAGFSKYAKKLGDSMSLRLFHEVLVLEPEQQRFERRETANRRIRFFASQYDLNELE